MSLLNSKTLRLALSVSLTVGAVSALSGCTDDEIAASALVIGAAAIVAGGDNDVAHRGDHRGYDRGPDRGPDRDFGPGRGPQGPGPGDFDRGPRGPGPGPGPGQPPGAFDRHPHAFGLSAAALNLNGLSSVSSAMTSLAAKTPAFKSSDARVTALASNYGISDYAATYLVRAIVMAQAKDTTGVKELGLQTSDFKNIYEGRDLAANKISILAAKLKMKESATAQLVRDMSADVAAEKAARGL